MTKKEYCWDNELKKWFEKWNRKVVTGRCLIELKEMNKEFTEKLKEKRRVTITPDKFDEEIDKLARGKLNANKCK